MYPTEQIELLKRVYGFGVEERKEGDTCYMFIPGLPMPQGCTPKTTDAMFCTAPYSTVGGYTSRLFLKDHVQSPHTPNNWQPYLLMRETWFAYSHNNVQSGPYPEMIINHMRGLMVPC
jgi:hypothetical protein